MSNIVNIPTQLHKKTADAELIRLRQIVIAAREQAVAQYNAIEAMIEALLGQTDSAARYQRQRSICSDRTRIRAFLEGRE